MLFAFVVMPNHVHCLIGLRSKPGPSFGPFTLGSDPRSPIVPNAALSSISPVAGSLPTIVRSYKSAVTREIRQVGDLGFAWQTRYHEHIVRDRRAFLAIRQYIEQHPARWRDDRFCRDS